MIDRTRLLADCQSEAKRLVESLRERLTAEPQLRQKLEAEHQAATKVGRTGDTFTEWLEERLEQVAASWVLACVFVRFLEDNDLVEVSRLSGPGDRLTRARDEETVYFRKFPSHSVRDYMEDVFRATATLPGMTHLLGEGRNALWTLGPTGDGARELLELWRRRDADTGVLVHDFTDPGRDTRFLGDLYQDLSEFARKRYALLQTPEFVEEFILDRTLEPALAEFGLEHTTLIDPACGSGHFLLGAFARLLRRWQKKEPATNPAALAQKALAAVAGVDLNPFAVAIARFRLLVGALAACGIARLKAAPAFEVSLAAGDALLHGPRPDDGRSGNLPLPGLDPNEHYYAVEDAQAVKRILSRQYAVVVANPPYITPKDSGLNKLYRTRFGSCHGLYSLAVPFKERCFDLVQWAEEESRSRAGFVGMITANSFMKRKFGSKLVADYFPRWDLTHVIDTSGLSEAALVGHLTPTVILIARGRSPLSPTVRTVRSIRSEPASPEDPASGGVVWKSITSQIDQPGSEDRFCSTDDTVRATFHRHPWSLGGGGAADLKERLDESCERRLCDLVESVGFVCITKQDEAFVQPLAVLRRWRCPPQDVRPFGIGEDVRDWCITSGDYVIFPYTDDVETKPKEAVAATLRAIWPLRTTLWDRKVYGGQTYREVGKPWYEYGQIPRERFRMPLAIAFPFVATHNHFAFDCGGKVFNRTAPVIKLHLAASLDEHLALLGLLNGSVVLFWLRQVCAPKGKHSTKVQSQPWGRRFEFDGTKVSNVPIPDEIPSIVCELARRLEATARRLVEEDPMAVLQRCLSDRSELRSGFATAGQRRSQLRNTMVALQEELDWACYGAMGLLPSRCAPEVHAIEEPEPIPATARPFEILLARRVAAGEEPPYWFETLQRTPQSSIPETLTSLGRARISARLKLIEEVQEFALLESPECKRKWEPLDTRKREQTVLRAWLLDRVEATRYWSDPPSPRSAAQLADLARNDPEFLKVAEVYRGRPDFDVTALVTELVEAESVPAQAALRYKPSGLRNREEWRRTWDLQRQEDAIDARTSLPEGDPDRLTSAQAQEEKGRVVGNIPAPPTYDEGDFQSPMFWQQRGKLDVPKEQFISLVGAERDSDPTPVVLWAGYDHLQQAQAIAGYYVERKEQDAWTKDRLLPLLVALHELVPWLKQWHNAFDPAYGLGLGDYFAGFVDDEARAHGLTRADLDAWAPAKPAHTTPRKAASATKPASKSAPDDDGSSGAEAPANGTPVTKKKPGRKKKAADPGVAT